MASFHVQGRVHTVDLCTQAGQLEFNTYMPLIGYSVVDATRILTNALSHLAHKCVRGMKVNEERVKYYVEHSAGLATALNPVLGYDTVAALVKEALAQKKTVRQLVIEKRLLSQAQVNKYLNPKNLTRPNV